MQGSHRLLLREAIETEGKQALRSLHGLQNRERKGIATTGRP